MRERVKLSRRENIVQILKFVTFSIGAGIIQIVSFTLLNELTGFAEWLSYLISLVLSVLYNFTVNRRFTFKSANNIPLAMLLVALFYLAFTPYSTWLTNFLTKKAWNEYIVVALNMIQNLLLEFLWCRFVVYRKSINTNSLAKSATDGENQTDKD